MIQSETLFTLFVHPVQEESGFSVVLTMEGDPTGAPWRVSLSRWRELHASVDLYRRHIKETASPPELARHALEGVGLELFATFLEPCWEVIREQALPGRPRMLTIASPVAEILLLPWEAALPPTGAPMGLEPGFFIRRLPADGEGPRRCCLYLPPPPLRILFMASAPTDQDPMEADLEAEAFLRALLSQEGAPPVWEIVEGGGTEALRQHILHFQPHVVHLCGPSVIREERGFFCFEEADGTSNPRSGKEMDRELLARAPVQVLVVSGRSADAPPPSAALGMVCRDVARHGVPLTISHPVSLASPQGAAWAAAFYGGLARHGEIDAALLDGRRAILTMGEASGHPGWTLPLLFGSTTQRMVMNRAAPAVRPPASPTTSAWDASRRRVLQRLLPALKEGQVQGALLTGAAGAGKSAMVTTLSLALQHEGWTPLPLQATPHRPLTVARLLEVVRRGVLTLGHLQEAESLKNPEFSLPDRLSLVLALFSELPFLLILENLEQDLDGNGRVRDREFALFLPLLLQKLGGASRVLVTSRTVPELGEALPAGMMVAEIPPLSRGVALRHLLKQEPLSARLRYGDLAPLHLESLLPDQGILPARLAPVTARLAAGEPLPSDWHDDFPTWILSVLPQEERTLLARAACWGFPVPIAAFHSLLGLDEAGSLVEAWQEAGLLQQESAGAPRWQVAPWLTAALAPFLTEEQATHQRAGEYLLACFEENREEELGLDWVGLLLEARGHFLRSGDFAIALNLTERVCEGMWGMGLQHEVRRLHTELLAWQRHPVSLNRIGQSWLLAKSCSQARPWFQEAQELAEREKGLEQEARLALLGLAQCQDGVG